MRKQTILNRAARGAKLLDQMRPGWARRTKIKKLKMDQGWIDNKGCGCVLAQEFCTFGTGLAALDVYEVGKFGFVADSDPEYAVLDEAWKDEIRKRRAA
jgi:hypothetical protein